MMTGTLTQLNQTLVNLKYSITSKCLQFTTAVNHWQTFYNYHNNIQLSANGSDKLAQ